MNGTIHHIKKMPPDTQGIDPNVAHIMQHIESYTQKVDQLISRLQLSIPKYVDEYLYAQGLTTLTVNPQSQNLEMIHTVITVVSATGGGTLTLGSGSLGTIRTINVPTGTTVYNFSDCGMLLSNGDARELVQGTAGLLGLELLGVELVDKGVF